MNTFDLILLGILVSLTLLIYFGRKATKAVCVQHMDIQTDCNSLSGEGIRVLHLSDLHVERLKIHQDTVVDEVKGLNPDLIALTGDYCERAESIPMFLCYVDQLIPLVPAGAVYVVFGNHDHYLGHHLEALRKELEARGCTVLSNESTSVTIRGQKINLIGIDDYCLRFHDVTQSFAGLPEEGYNLVLAHDPDTLLVLEEEHRVDIMLSGHLHGIQVRFPMSHRVYPMGTLMKNKVYRGYHEVNGRSLYISRGLGQSGLNIRLRSKPEITLHQLRGSLSEFA